MKLKKMFSMLLVSVIVFSLGAVTVFAEGEKAAETYPLKNVVLTKYLKVANGVDITSFNTFKFKFEADSSTTAKTEDHPKIDNQTVTVGTQSGDQASGTISFDKVFENVEFKHAGEYVYTVSEVNDKKSNLTYDSSKYTVRIYVINGANGGLEIKGVTVENKDGKVNPTKDFKFTNTYAEDLDNKDGVLTVKKVVTGDYGDKTKTFPVTVTLNLPSTAKADDVAVADGATWDANKKTATADLKDGGSIVFTKLPAGTTFTVEESQDTYYDGKVSGDLVKDATFDAGENVTAKSTGPILDSQSKTVTLTNNRADIIPTGVIINNLHYILLVVIAGLGVAFIVLKRKYNNA